jgi:succinate dehydrogenase hydrophobic anchor subunit
MPVPRYLTLAALAAALCVAILAGELLTGILPAAAVAVLVAADYVLWERRERPWHDWTVILLLLPAIFAAVWIAVGGLILDVARTDGARLAFEVGPGVALVGLLCTLISYHGRHHPDEDARRNDTGRP